jgi:CheY-like chemotaxis protein
MSQLVLFIDDDELERRSCSDVLNEVFAGTTIRVEARQPLPALADYAGFVADATADALIIDERLNTSGGVAYTGVELAAHMRAIGGNLPIVILTNYPEDDFDPQGWAVESIVAKRDLLHSPVSPTARAFKARLSRQIEVAGTVRAEREQRYHDLLVKSTDGPLRPEEDEDLRRLEAERIAPVAAAEREREQKLDVEIEKLRRLLGDGRLL